MQSSNAKTKTKWTNNLMNPETNEISKFFDKNIVF